VEAPLLLQFCTALFTGMVAATFVPPVRKAIPRIVEVGLWIALITCCVLGVMSVSDGNARDLSMSALWGADQVINTIIGLMLGGVAAWLSEHRFVLATWLVIVAGVDVFVLMLLTSIRSATPWQPRVRLREWMELPVASPARVPVQAPVVADPLVGVNRRLAAVSALLAAAMLARTLDFSIWARDAVRVRRLHRAARASAATSSARLESLREAIAHLQFAARSWYAAAGEPAISGVGERVTDAASRSARAAKRGLRSGALRPGQVIDIRALLNAPTIGWYGSLMAAPADSTRGDDDATQPQQPDTLAS
jgi:hypothetical protein